MSGGGGRRRPGRALTSEEERVAARLSAQRVAALSLVDSSTREIREWLGSMGEVSRPALAAALGVDRATVTSWAAEHSEVAEHPASGAG
jgi:DNA-binding transcriptional regulator YiaG